LDQGGSILLVHAAAFGWPTLPSFLPPRHRAGKRHQVSGKLLNAMFARQASWQASRVRPPQPWYTGGETCNWTSHSDGQRSGVVQGHEWFGLVTSLRVVIGSLPPRCWHSDQGHFQDDFRTAAYDHVRSSPFLADILTSWVLTWGCVFYISLQIFTLWQKS